MTPANPQLSTVSRPRVGIPWRTSDEEEKARTAGPNWKPGRTEDYRKAVERAGGEAVLIPLKDEEARKRLIPALDAFVLPGSSADVDPREYQNKNRGQCEEADKDREKADRAVLSLAFAEKRPVLAICYGFQMLNVCQGGSLIQDIQTELKDKSKKLERHRKKDPPSSTEDPRHGVTLEPDSRLVALASGPEARVNSSHHQAINRLGRDLKITARATDGIIEGVEWTGDPNWVVGVQWHPERIPDDPFAQRLFQQLVAAARAHEAVARKT
jgi:putative glutamine amidotransferase